MNLVTFQVMEGLERGRVFADLPTPVTMGREDENQIQLNDERVSRFHAKIQSDAGRAILTDLDSTNGTRVNGHPIQMRVLRIGDQVAIGRCLLIYGSREEIAAELGGEPDSSSPSFGSDPNDRTIAAPSSLSNFEEDGEPSSGLSPQESLAEENNQPDLFPHGPPDPPESLRPIQCAEISDFLSYTHEQIGRVLQAAIEENSEWSESDQTSMRVDSPTWKRLLQLEMDLAIYMRKLIEPTD